MNTIIDKNTVLISSALVVKEEKGKKYWFVVKNEEDGNWEFPHIVVRKVESSVRAALRMLGEQASMTVRLLEEVGRSGGVTNINNKVVLQRHLYYLAIHQSSADDVVGFAESEWVEDSKILRKLNAKMEQKALKVARDEYKSWKKKRDKRLELEKELEEDEPGEE